MDISILSKYKALVTEYKKTEPIERLQLRGRDDMNRLAASTTAKRLVRDIISSRVDIITYKAISLQLKMKESIEFHRDIIKPSETSVKSKSCLVKGCASSSSVVLTPDTQKEIYSNSTFYFDFKTYFQKQLSNEVNDAVKMFDHLQNSLLQAQVLKEKLSTIKSFRIKLDQSNKVKRSDGSGFGIIIDPKFNTNGKTLTMKFTYRDAENKACCEEIPIQSSGDVPEKYRLTLNSQLMSEYHNKHIPGWDGVVPGFVPIYDCQCELKTEDVDDAISVPITFLMFPASSSANIFKLLSKSVDDFNVKIMSNSKVMGGMPLLNLAALQGDTKVIIMSNTTWNHYPFSIPVSIH